MYSAQNDTIRQITGLSSGTLASLTGLRRYDDLDTVHAAFLHFAENSTKTSSAPFTNWQVAWRHFQAAAEPPGRAGQSPHDRLCGPRNQQPTAPKTPQKPQRPATMSPGAGPALPPA